MAQGLLGTGLCIVLSPCGGASSSSDAKEPPQPAASGTNRAEPKQVAESEQGSSESQRPVGTKLLRDVDQSPKEFKIGRNDSGKGLGKFDVTVDGRAIWPPKGEGCADLERCCTELTAINDKLALACLLATDRDGNCATARHTASQIALEQGIQPPTSCGH